jgi:thymidylate synthase
MATLEDLTPEARDELALLYRELAENKDTRGPVLKLTKHVRPNLPLPEIEISEALEKTESKTNERVQQLEAKLHEKEMREELERRRRNLLSKKKVESEDQIAEVEKVMLEKGIQNHETAAEYWAWMNQAAAPTPTGYRPNVMDGTAREMLSRFWKNPVNAARDEAAKALNELRKNPKPVGF